MWQSQDATTKGRLRHVMVALWAIACVGALAPAVWSQPGTPVYVSTRPDAEQDSWTDDAWERVSQSAKHPDSYDLAGVSIGQDETWLYLQMELRGPVADGLKSGYYYHFNIDVDEDGRGDYLYHLKGHKVDTTWKDTSEVWLKVYQDTDKDVGGDDPAVAEGESPPPGLDGFDSIFPSERDHAYVRIAGASGDDANRLELAVRLDRIGQPLQVHARAWAGEKAPKFSKFYVHDAYAAADVGDTGDPDTIPLEADWGDIANVDESGSALSWVPLCARLGDFQVIAADGWATATWETVWEGDAMSFELYRGTEADIAGTRPLASVDAEASFAGGSYTCAFPVRGAASHYTLVAVAYDGDRLVVGQLSPAPSATPPL